MGRIKPTSDKKLALAPLRKEVIKQRLELTPYCVLNQILGNCQNPLDVDEIILKSDWAYGQYVLENTQSLCRSHHNMKHHQFVEAAMIIGLYGRDRMLRYEMTIEQRIEYFYVFSKFVNEMYARDFIEDRLQQVIEKIKP